MIDLASLFLTRAARLVITHYALQTEDRDSSWLLRTGGRVTRARDGPTAYDFFSVIKITLQSAVAAANSSAHHSRPLPPFSTGLASNQLAG